MIKLNLKFMIHGYINLLTN